MRRLVVVALLAVAVLPAVVRAQETGGSIGGGSFEEESPPSSSSGGSSYASGSSGGSAGIAVSGVTAGGAGGPSSPLTTVLILSSITVIVVAVLIYTARERAQAAERMREQLDAAQQRVDAAWARGGAIGALVDVAVVSIAVDWRARRFVQAALAKLAATGDTKSKAGLATLLAGATQTLLSVEPAWLYAGARNASPSARTDAQAAFQSAVLDARSRFQREVVRNADGTTTSGDAGELRARPTEGPGVVVVTLVAAARREIVDVRSARDARELRQLLTALGTLGRALTAMEIVWSPAAEDDRMSTLELEARYPDLQKLDETSLAGRVFCGHCGGPFPRELGTCPHCGAPVG